MSAIPPECARLAAELRALRQRVTLSLATLAEESAYSKSSWHRCLNGTALPPWHAVRVLCRLADEPEARVRALWELAEAAWSRRGAVEPQSADPPGQPDRTPRQRTDAGRRPAGGAGAAAEAAVTPQGPPGAPPTAARIGTSSGAAAPTAPSRRRWRRRRLVATLAAIAATSTALTAGAVREWGAKDASESAGFHVGCTGTPCDGADPGVMLCGVEPQTLLHVLTPGGAGLEVRYNQQCRAAWARVWNTRLGDRLTLSESGEPAQSVTIRSSHSLDAFVYTRMVSVTDRRSTLKVCLATASKPTATCYPVPPP